MRLDPAAYQWTTNDYLCNLCGWQGRPDLIGVLGWCPTDRISCPKCGPDVFEEVEEKRPQKPNLAEGFWWL